MSTPPGTPSDEPITLPCVECGDETYNVDRNPVLCRECNITRMLEQIQCSSCERMRYRTDDDYAPLPGLAQALFGARCQCDPKTTPTMYDARNG